MGYPGARLIKELAGCTGGRPNGEVSEVPRLGPPTGTNGPRAALKDGGMVSFAAVLDRSKVDAIHAYLIHRANEDKAAAGH